MATLAGGFCLPHDPLVVGAKNAADPAQAQRVFAAFARVRSEIEALEADAAIVIGDDHFAMFGTGCQPSILIGIGDLEGPIEPWLGIPRGPIPNDPELAQFIMEYGFDHGFDWAVAKTLALDHSTMVPIHLSVPTGMAVLPVYVSCGTTPIIRALRCRQLGEMLGNAVREMPSERRVVILGTGGLSHWVGMADMGRVNIEFDRKVIGIVERGDLDGLVRLTDDEIIHSGGNGALEIRNWIVAMAALPGHRARVLDYEPVEPWITGLGFVQLVAQTGEPSRAVVA